MYPFDVGRVKENLPTTHVEIGSESERRTFEQYLDAFVAVWSMSTKASE